jgi:pilus assembly protein CpaE
MLLRLQLELFFLFWRVDEETLVAKLFMGNNPAHHRQEKYVMSAISPDADLVGMGSLSLVVIGPDEQRRRSITAAIAGQHLKIARELPDYPDVDDVAELLEGDHDAVVIDLDPDPERALDLVENICEADGGVTVMVYSGHTDHDLLLRCMRAGAREFLTEPLDAGTIAEAMVRASARGDELRRPKKKATGKLFVFTGAKGGAGVTTIAANFAVALSRHCEGKTALVDLELELGDAALTLGVTPKFSVMDGIQELSRLDAEFFSALLTKHTSGLSVLAAPDQITTANISAAALMRIVTLAREQFAHVVVDAGSRHGAFHEALFEAASMVYLVAQVSVADLRNANRLIKRFFHDAEPGRLQTVLNRYHARGLEIDEASIVKALTRPVNWKVPNDYVSARKAQNTGHAMAVQETPISRVFQDMAREASGQVPPPGKRRKFGLFR